MKIRTVVSALCILSLTGCAGTAPRMGSQDAKTTATGSAGGANSANANSQLERCDKPFGTVALVEESTAEWYRAFTEAYKLGSTVPALRLLIQQSNCFIVVERGRAFQNIERERALAGSGESRDNSNFGKGQLVAADYSITPEVLISAKGTSGIGGGALGLLGGFGLVAGAIAGGIKTNEAATILTIIDNRSGVQVAAAEGSATNTDFNVGAVLFGGSTAVGLGGYTNTPQGKVVIAAFTDSYNNIVKSLRNYTPQAMAGGRGLGAGGTLTVDGASTTAPKATPPKPTVAAAAAPPAAPVISIKAAQEQLNKLGYSAGTPDGLLGKGTVAALREFQKDRNLRITGRIDQATSSALSQ